MSTRLYCFTLKKIKWCLTLVIAAVFIMLANFWAGDFDNQQEFFYTLSPYPLNKMLGYESTLCTSPNIHIEPPRHNNIRCPQKPIVTVKQLGRLGNQIYEYASVWAIAKKTGREPYVPSCLIHELEKVFRNLTVPPLSYLAYCTVQEFPIQVKANEIDHFNGSILLPRYAQLPIYIAPVVKEVRQMFQFKEHLVDESQRLLHNASRGVRNITYVGVHVRRTDYQHHLQVWYNVTMLKPDFFLRQMNVLRNKYKPVMFVVLSDDPEWCERELGDDDVVVMRNNSPAQDLAIMAACNHSIIDYGTYGMWGALLAGGDTFVYNFTISFDAAFEMASLLPNWHLVI